MPFESHEAYFATVPADVRARLQSVRQEVQRRVPGAQACIGYNMPAFRQQRIFFYFAAFKHHIGVYPPLTQDQALIQETARYRGPTRNLSFPLERFGFFCRALQVDPQFLLKILPTLQPCLFHVPGSWIFLLFFQHSMREKVFVGADADLSHMPASG